MTPAMMKTALDSRSEAPVAGPGPEEMGLLERLKGFLHRNVAFGPEHNPNAKLRALFGLDEHEDPAMLAGASRELYRRPPFSAEPFDPTMRAAWESQQRRYL